MCLEDVITIGKNDDAGGFYGESSRADFRRDEPISLGNGYEMFASYIDRDCLVHFD